MDIRKLQRAIVDGLEDVKAQNIVVFNTEAMSPLFERVIIASGTSNRQTKALAASVRDSVKAGGMAVMRTEGEDNGEWIIVDCGAAVAHIMQPAIRDYYRLEEIWGAKPVKMKFGDTTQRPLARASEPEPAPARKAAATKASAKKAPAKKSPAKKSPAGKTVARKSAAAQPAARKSPAGKKAAAGAPKRAASAPRQPAARKSRSGGPARSR
jgi:ribosome-associated protein